MPLAGAQVVFGESLGIAKTLAQQLCKEVVVAIPAPFVVQGDEEQIGALEAAPGSPGRSRGRRTASQRAAQAVENGCVEQERLHALGLPVQDFFDEIVQDEAVAAGERLDEAGEILLPLHGERGQLQAGDPAFGAALEGGDVLHRELQAHHLVEEVGRLVG